MNTQSPSISVVICAYTEDRWDDMIAAVESLRRQTRPIDHIVLVIDHNPSLLERARASFPGVQVVENSQPRGLSGARNSGVSAARGDLIAFLDDDAIATPDWLCVLTEWLADPQIMGAGGIVEPQWETRRPAWFPQEFDWVVGCSYRGLPLTPASIRNLFGGCMCIRREVFDAVGGFRVGIGRDEKRPMGCEETELCIRATQHWPQRCFYYEPRAWAYHRVPAMRCTWRYFRSRCYAEGLSKALITEIVGSRDGLAAERRHAFVILPRGVWRNLADAVVRRDPAGLARAGAILGGLAFTIAGYAIGRLTRRSNVPTLQGWRGETA